jgi:hypothetical protein
MDMVFVPVDERLRVVHEEPSLLYSTLVAYVPLVGVPF